MCMLRIAVVSLGVVATILAACPLFAQTREQQIADAKAEMERAKKYLQALARQRQGLTEGLNIDEKKWVGTAILDWYQTSRKFNSLREQRDNGDISEEEAIRRLEEFTGVETGELSLEGAFVKAGEKIRKGRLQRYDDLDRRQDLVMQGFRDAWERVRELENRPWPDEVKAAERVRGGPLTLKAVPNAVDLEVGEPKIVTLVVSGSKPPYTLRVVSLSGDDTRVLRPGSQDFVDLPFSFSTPGVRTVDISLEDESIPRQRARVTVTFRVTEPEEDEGEPEEEPPPQPPEPDAGDEEKEDDQTSNDDDDKEPEEEEKEEDDGYKPRKLESGSYNGLLFCHRMTPPHIGFTGSGEQMPPPVPVTVTIDATGDITGKADYEYPIDKNRTEEMGYLSYRMHVAFNLTGKVDPDSGKVTLAVPDYRHVFESTVDESPYDKPRSVIKPWGCTIEFSAALNGWVIPGSNDRELMMLVDENGRRTSIESGLGGKDPEKLGLPRIGPGPDGQPAFAVRGFFGNRAAQDGHSSIQYRYKSDVFIDKDTRKDRTAHSQAMAEKYPANFWYLKILGPIAVEEKPEEEEYATDEPEGELISFGLWPESPLRVKAGAAFQLEAVGTYAENIFDVKTLHDDRSQWAASRGLEKLDQPGQYQAPGPGTYQVRVRRRRTDGGWNGDAITIHVVP